MSKKMHLAALIMLLLCLSACGNNNAVETSNTDPVEEVASEQADEIPDTVASPETVEEEPVDLVEADESVNADDESANDENEIPEQNEVENTEETKLEEAVTRTECNETVYTNTSSNIRTQPSSTAEKIETVNKGTELLRTAILDNGWSEIQYNDTTCYISSKLVDTEPIAETVVAESEPVETATAANETTTPATSTSTASVSDGTTKTFSDGTVFVVRGQTPGGRPIWYMESDKGTWPDYIIAAYDATGITADMSDYDKAVAINNYICKVVDYAYENGVDDRAAYCACLTYGKAICTGYSHAFTMLCTIAGVGSDQVGGVAGQNSHSWNYVLIGDVKYWVDVQMNDETNNAFLMSTSQFPGYTANY